MSRFKFVCSIFLIWNCSGEVFRIIRKSGLNDEFEVSSGGSNNPVVCNDYGADTTNTDQKCVCELNNAKNSTFGHFDHRWQCFDFREILKNQGCRTIYGGSRGIHTINDIGLLQFQTNYVKFHTQSSAYSCQTEQNNSLFYHSCNGQWTLDKSGFNGNIQIYPGVWNSFKVQINGGGLIGGRFYLLKFHCSKTEYSSRGPQYFDECLLFRINGTMTCSTSTTTTDQITSVNEISKQVLSTKTNYLHVSSTRTSFLQLNNSSTSLQLLPTKIQSWPISSSSTPRLLARRENNQSPLATGKQPFPSPKLQASPTMTAETPGLLESTTKALLLTTSHVQSSRRAWLLTFSSPISHAVPVENSSAIEKRTELAYLRNSSNATTKLYASVNKKKSHFSTGPGTSLTPSIIQNQPSSATPGGDSAALGDGVNGHQPMIAIICSTLVVIVILIGSLLILRRKYKKTKHSKSSKTSEGSYINATCELTDKAIPVYAQVIKLKTEVESNKKKEFVPSSVESTQQTRHNNTYDYARPDNRFEKRNVEKHDLNGYLTPLDARNSKGIVYDTERYLIPKEVVQSNSPSNSAQTQIVSKQQEKCLAANGNENIYDTAMEVLPSESDIDVIYQVLEGPDPNVGAEPGSFKENCETTDDTFQKLYEELEEPVEAGNETEGVYQQLRDSSIYESLEGVLLEYEHGEIEI